MKWSIDFIVITFILMFFQVAFAKSQIVADAKDSIVITPAQQPYDIRRPIAGVLQGQMDYELLAKTPDDYAYVWVLAVVIDENGHVERMYTTDQPHPNIKAVVKPGAELESKMREIKYVFKGYENSTLVIPFFFIRMFTQNISTKSNFMDSFLNMWPSIPLKSDKPIVLLKPFMMPFPRKPEY